MSPLCYIVCTRYACTYSRTYTDIFSIWLMCTIKNVTISQMSQTNVNFTNSPNLFWCLVLTINKSCNETCHRQSDRISEKIIKTKKSSYSLQIIAIDSYAKCKASIELSVQYIIKVLVKTPLSIVSRFKFTHSCIFLWMKYFSQ